MTRDEKLKELINLFEFFKDYEKKRTVCKILATGLPAISEIHFENALEKFYKLVDKDSKFKNDGSVEEHIEMKIWVIVNRYK